MGKGDKKTKRGKINIGSYGVTRPRKKKKSVATPVEKVEKKEKPAKKEAAIKEEKPKAEKPKASKKAAAKKKEAEE